jgi:urease accessory protein
LIIPMNDAAPIRLAADVASRQRARGEARVRFARAGARSAAERVFETGGLRLRFPRSEAECEAVLVNTGGGMAGGDRASIAVEVGVSARALVTTQSAEKIYRCEDEPARVETRLSVEPGGSLVWAPQETLLFDRASLQRRLDAEVAADASLLIFEAAVFGRLASGETDVAAQLHDRWRIRRAGRLVFAEALRLVDAAAALDRPAVGAGARAIATILCVAPDAEAQAPNLRAALEAVAAEPGETLDVGASGFDGMAVARLVSPSPSRLRTALIAAMLALRGREAPRVWS